MEYHRLHKQGTLVVLSIFNALGVVWMILSL